MLHEESKGNVTVSGYFEEDKREERNGKTSYVENKHDLPMNARIVPGSQPQ